MSKEIKGQYLYVNNTDGKEGMKRILIKIKQNKTEVVCKRCGVLKKEWRNCGGCKVWGKYYERHLAFKSNN